MEINRKSWHFRFLNWFNPGVTSNLLHWPEVYANLCYYSHKLVEAILLITLVAAIGTAFGLLILFSVSSLLYRLALCAIAGVWVPEVGLSNAGIVILSTLAICAVISRSIYFLRYSNESDRILDALDKLQPIADWWSAFRGRYCIKVTFK